MTAGPVLAVDVGGTKLAAGVVDPDGRVLAAARTPTPAGPGVDAEAVWAALTEVVGQLGLPAQLAGVGVGCGGPMSWPAGEVSPLNIPAWRGFPLRRRLQEAFPGLPVRLHNDAVCVAVAEHWRGAGRGTADLLGMVVSTGVGGGLVLGGRLVDGPSGNAGHIGHVVVDPQGPPCSCGGHGCLEAVASGPRLAAWASSQGWRDGAGGSARELADDARGGDPVARSAWDRAGRALGVAIASAAHLCDVRLVCVGGGLAEAGPLLFAPLHDALRRHARMEFTRGLRVVPATLGPQTGLVGAAGLVARGDRYWSAD